MTDKNQKETQVTGQGGGGGSSKTKTKTKVVIPKQRTSVEVSNNLFSTAFAKTVYALSEGEIEGFPTSANRDIFLDGVPLENVDGSKNFEGFTTQFKTGTNAQDALTGFTQSENVTNVGVQVEEGAPIVRSIIDTDVERCRVIISHPSLLAQNVDNGDITGTSVRYKILLSVNGGVYTTVVDKTVSGKSNSEFQRAYEFNLTGNGPWRVKVERVTSNSSNSRLANDIIWQSFVEIIDEKLAYPNTAVLGVKVDARQFSTIPDVSVRLKGKRVQIPSNYNPTTRTYTGVWDGTFVDSWTDNPAWIFRDICMNERYGVRRYASNLELDKWSLYTISQYCDENVFDGKGGYEPRFTCNVYLQNPGSVYQVLNSLASCFRGLLYYNAGELYVTQDRAQVPVQQFSEANVIQDVDESGKVVRPCFSYVGSARAARKTVCIASWDDPTQNYAAVAEYQQDDVLLERFGYNPVDLRLLGVTSRGQALRAAKHTLFSNRYETDKVSFRIGAEGLAAGVGEVIQIADPVRQGQRLGGRVKSVNGNSVTLDALLNLDDSISYDISIVIPNGEEVINPDSTRYYKPKLLKANVLSDSTDADDLTTTLVTDQVPPTQKNVLWVLEWVDLKPAQYRIVSIAEVEPLVYQVEAIQYNNSKYAYVDNNLPIAVPRDRFEIRTPTEPVNLSGKLQYSNGTVYISASWKPPQVSGAADLLIRGYRYQWRKVNDANWSEVITIQDTNIDIPLQTHVFGNQYQVKVATVDRLGEQSEFAEYDVDSFDPIPDLSDPDFAATVTHANQPDGTQLIIVDPGTTPIPERVNGYKCWCKPRVLVSGEIPGVKPPNEEGWYFLADIPLTGYYTVAFHAPDTYDVRVNFTSAIFGEQPDDYIYDFVQRAEIAPPTPSNFGVVENQNSSGKRFSWQLPLTEYGSWDQQIVADVVGYEVRYKSGTLPANVVEFNLTNNVVLVKTGTVIGTKVNQHLINVGDEVVFEATTGVLPTGVTSGQTYFVVDDDFTSTQFRISATSGGSPVDFTGTATGVYTITGPADLSRRLNIQAAWDAGIELASGGLPAQQQWFETSLFDRGTFVVMVKSVDATQWRADVPAFVLVNIGAPPVSNAVQSIDAKNAPTDDWPGTYDNCEVLGGNLVQIDAELDSFFYWNFDNNNSESSLLFETTSTATVEHRLVALTGNDNVVSKEDGDGLLLEDLNVVIDVSASDFELQRDGTTFQHDLSAGDTLEFVEVSGTLPTGISTGTTYFVATTDLTTTSFRVAATSGGAAITLSGSASGTYAARGFNLLAEQRFYSDTELAKGGVVHPYAPFEKLLGDVYRVVTRFKSPDGGVTAGNISALTAELDYPDIIEKQNDVAIAAAGTPVSLTKTFRSVESVSITALQTGGSTAVTAVVTAKASDSVTIKCLDSSGTGVTGLVDLLIVGY